MQHKLLLCVFAVEGKVLPPFVFVCSPAAVPINIGYCIMIVVFVVSMAMDLLLLLLLLLSLHLKHAYDPNSYFLCLSDY